MVMERNESAPKFYTGRLLATPGVLKTIPSFEVISALRRHILGDWGIVDQEDWLRNDEALVNGARLFSAYRSAKNVKFWIITESDRSSTTVLLPSEY